MTKYQNTYDISDDALSVLRVIVSQQLQGKLPPSLREIMTACNVYSSSTVVYHLNKLKERGLIKRERKIARGIRAMPAAFLLLSISVELCPHCGQPIYAESAKVPSLARRTRSIGEALATG